MKATQRKFHERFIATCLVLCALSLGACSEEDGDTTTDAGADVGVDTGGSDTGNTGQPPAPVVTELDCSNLPAALQGGPANEKFWIEIGLDLSCSLSDPTIIATTGGRMELEYYIDSDFRDMTMNWTFADTADVSWKLVSASHGEPVEGINGNVFRYTGIPENTDVTITLTDNETETRTLEVVVHFAPPYVALMSITEK